MKKQESGVRGQGPGKTEDQPTITAHTVKAALWELGEAASGAVEDHLKVKTFKERFKVKQILAALVGTCEAEIGGPPEVTTYRLTGKSAARGQVQAKLWEFACLRFATAKPFTAVEAARLAEHNLDYTKRYCRWLWNYGYLAIVSRGRAGAMLYQVVGGKEHESAPPWNRRAEKRKNVGQAPSPAGQGSGVRGQEKCTDWDPECGCLGTPQLCPGACPMEEDSPAGTPAPPEAGGAKTIMRAALEAGYREKLDAALEDFGMALVDITGSIGRAWEVIREMKGELLAIGEQGHDEPGEPTEGHH